MPTITVTLKKSAGDSWVLASRDHAAEHYTQEEIDNTLIPFLEYIKTLPGYDWANTTSVFSEDNNTLTTTHNFDTIENAIDADLKMFTPEEGTISYTRNQLVQSRIKSSGFNYTFSKVVLA